MKRSWPGVLWCAAIALGVLSGCPSAYMERGPDDLAGADLTGTNASGLSPFSLLVTAPRGGKDIDCTSATTCYVVGALLPPPAVFHQTRDGGRTWSQMTPPANLAGQALTLVSVRFHGDQGFAVGSTALALYLLGTTDGGITWNTLAATGLPGGALTTPTQIALDGSAIWVVMKGPGPGSAAAGLYRSTDGGSSFQQVIHAVPMVTLANYSNLACDGLGSCVSGDKSLLNTPIFLATTDGFATSHTAMLATAMDGVAAVRSLGGGQFVAIGAQTISSSADSGASWSSLMQVGGTALQALDCTAAGLCYAGGSSATLLQSFASGQPYAVVVLPSGVTSVTGVRVADPTAVYLLTDQGVAKGPN